MHASHPGVQISQQDIYDTTGAPLPNDIAQILSWCLTLPFAETYTRILAIQTAKGYALTDIITGLFSSAQRLEMSVEARVFLVDALAAVEYNLTAGTSERIQLGAVVGAFKCAVDMIEHGPSR